MHLRLLCTIGMVLLSLSSHGGTWSVGGGGLFAQNLYRETKVNRLVIPFIGYENKYIYWYGPFAQLRKPIDKYQTVGLQFELGMMDFERGDSSNPQMGQISPRRRLYYLGPYYRYKVEHGTYKISTQFDVTGRTKGGYEININYSYPHLFRSYKVFIKPSLGVFYQNAKLVNYFYQVSNAESTRTGFRRYQPGSIIQPYLSLFGSFQISKNLAWTNIIGLDFVPNKIRSSPITNNNRFMFSLITGLTYSIK